MLAGMAYPGGKNGAGVYQKIINLMPPHNTYIEPFLGGGAVMRLKRPARVNIGFDLSAAALAAFGGAVPEYSTAGTGGGGLNLDVASPVSACGSGIAVTAAPARSGEASSLTGHAGKAKSTFGPVASSVHWAFERRDGLEYLEAAASERAMRGTLIYCDPPYLMSTRSGRKLYEYEMPDADHRRLLAALERLSPFTMVMISGYWSEMYAEALAGWHSISFEAMTRGGRTATEWLWFNFPPPVELHDYRYLGEGFRERERINRKKRRWVARLAGMPVLERQSLFAAMAEIQLRTFPPRGTIKV